MNYCDPTHIRLDAYHDGELAPEAAARVEAHLAACPACARELSGIRATSAALARFDSGRLSEQGLMRIRHALRTASGDEVILPLLRRVAAAAAVVLAVGSVWLTRNTEGPGAPTVATWEHAAIAPAGADEGGADDLQFAAWVLADLKPGAVEER